MPSQFEISDELGIREENARLRQALESLRDANKRDANKNDALAQREQQIQRKPVPVPSQYARRVGLGSRPRPGMAYESPSPSRPCPRHSSTPPAPARVKPLATRLRDAGICPNGW
jgi:hypothetical protein